MAKFFTCVPQLQVPSLCIWLVCWSVDVCCIVKSQNLSLLSLTTCTSFFRRSQCKSYCYKSKKRGSKKAILDTKHWNYPSAFTSYEMFGLLAIFLLFVYRAKMVNLLWWDWIINKMWLWWLKKSPICQSLCSMCLIIKYNNFMVIDCVTW